MTATDPPSPVTRTLRTPGVLLLCVLGAIGLVAIVYRFVYGLEAATNLNDQHPWGLWIAVDVASGVALAAGGFTTAALAYIFGGSSYRVLVRPALLTALLGYTFVALGLLVDLGRPDRIWHPAWPTMWQGDSVLFEVGICMMCYLIVLYIEFLPVVCGHFAANRRYPRLGSVCRLINGVVKRTMFIFILLGVVLSCLHQSSLGNLLVLAEAKMDPLWYSPILALLFLLSAIMVGFPMVMLESLYASWALKIKPEMGVLGALARYVPAWGGLYLMVRLGDLALRDQLGHAVDGSFASIMLAIEIVVGLILPLGMMLLPRVRKDRALLLIASLLMVLGVALNRINVFLVAQRPPHSTGPYVPSLGEIAVTVGLIALLILTYRVIVTHLPVIGQPSSAEAA